MARASLTISSKNYSSFSLRGWLLCKIAGIDFDEEVVDIDHPQTRQELLLLSPSFRVPRLIHDKIQVYSILAIAEHLNEIAPKAGIWPASRAHRAHCRSVSGEMHSGFFNLRSALPMNLKARFEGFKIWSGAKPDIERILEIWRDCLKTYGGPYLFGDAPTLADAMYAPVCTRFRTYDVALEEATAAYSDTILSWAPMLEWTEAALAEPEEIEELDVEF